MFSFKEQFSPLQGALKYPRICFRVNLLVFSCFSFGAAVVGEESHVAEVPLPDPAACVQFCPSRCSMFPASSLHQSAAFPGWDRVGAETTRNLPFTLRQTLQKSDSLRPSIVVPKMPRQSPAVFYYEVSTAEIQ